MIVAYRLYLPDVAILDPIVTDFPRRPTQFNARIA